MRKIIENLRKANTIMSSGEKDKLKELQDKILLARKIEKSDQTVALAHKEINYGWRMVLELVIGTLMGFGIGYGLDMWLGTEPLLIVIMSLFGFGAGIRTMIKTASEISINDTKD